MAQTVLRAGDAGQRLARPVPGAASSAPLMVPERPARAPNVHLSGAMESGFQEGQWLIQRDGSFIQLPEVLYRILEYADGSRTLDELAAAVSETTARSLSVDNLRLIMGSKLIPRGLVASAGGAIDPAPGSAGGNAPRSPLAVSMRLRMVSPRFIDPLTAVLQFLYMPPVLVALLLVAAAGHAWLYFVHDLTQTFSRTLATPRLILILWPITVVSAAFHELGHASALRYGGGKVRGIGAGLYLVYPVFYTDVTDAYRLGRWARVRTDLGGFYFTLIFTLGLLGLYGLTGQGVLLVAILLLDLEILHQSLPFVRFDGYWALADLTGVPDFFSLMAAFVRSMVPLPWWSGYRLPRLKRWVKVVFIVYTLVTVPVLALMLVLMVKSVPGVLESVSIALGQQVHAFALARRASDGLGMAASVAQMIALILPAGGLLLILVTVGRRVLQMLWNWSKLLPAPGISRAGAWRRNQAVYYQLTLDLDPPYEQLVVRDRQTWSLPVVAFAPTLAFVAALTLGILRFGIPTLWRLASAQRWTTWVVVVLVCMSAGALSFQLVMAYRRLFVAPQADAPHRRVRWKPFLACAGPLIVGGVMAAVGLRRWSPAPWRADGILDLTKWLLAALICMDSGATILALLKLLRILSTGSTQERGAHRTRGFPLVGTVITLIVIGMVGIVILRFSVSPS